MLKLIVMEWPVLLTIIIKNLAVSYAANKQYNYRSARCIGSSRMVVVSSIKSFTVCFCRDW